jgi:hypothetical protein
VVDPPENYDHQMPEKNLRLCRRLCVLIYAAAIIYFLYAPWNYLLLAVLLFRRRTGTRAEREFPST